MYYTSVAFTHNTLKMPSIEIERDDPISSLDVNEINLEDNLMSSLSPNSPTCSIGERTSQCLDIHNPHTLMIEPNTLHYSKFMERRSYAVNCVCKFFFHCFDKRNSIAKKVKTEKIMRACKTTLSSIYWELPLIILQFCSLSNPDSEIIYKIVWIDLVCNLNLGINLWDMIFLFLFTWSMYLTWWFAKVNL
jgi:hypothetical protein